ncbi:hypothetical protein [Mesorhizobium captivum]|uniref:hypothetical protein n=1 Tax=Mesorhizobium captivum TaxID=3072319 RepID=UPI002A23F249|nr:hypothetical protein [Mesorhizobium sp. VK23E]MDX8513563.1 hypothetical protein [Mesorhizobium sp. VK23E]
MRSIGCETIYGVDGEHKTPYLTRIWIGRLRLHIFHRGDADPDCHDHPWDFWTFPLTSYVEEVALPARDTYAADDPAPPQRYYLARRLVPAFRWSYRPADYTHRVLGRYDRMATLEAAMGAFVVGARRVPPLFMAGKIVTVVWQGRASRKWGFLRHRDGQWCWTPWRDYVFGGGKHAPCEPEGGA